MRLAIRCRSSSNSIEIRGELTARGSAVSGNWEERTFNLAGDARGQVTGGRLALSVKGGGFSGSMSVRYSSSRQAVEITTQGISMKSVNVRMTRSG